MSRKGYDSTTKVKADAHDATYGLLRAAYKEMQELSKKRADGTLSPGQVKLINRLLVDVKAILQDEASSKYLDLLDDDKLPKNSEAVLVLSQWAAAMDKFKGQYADYNGNWNLRK